MPENPLKGKFATISVGAWNVPSPFPNANRLPEVAKSSLPTWLKSASARKPPDGVGVVLCSERSFGYAERSRGLKGAVTFTEKHSKTRSCFPGKQSHHHV